MTALTCEALSAAVSGFSLIRSCDIILSGALRISTPFYYPDTSNIDVFVERKKSLLDEVLVSDFGQTADLLLNIKLSPWGTKKRRQLVQEICSALNVEMDGGRIQVTLQEEEIGQLPDAIFRVAQASLRVSDLYMTKRLYMPSAYKEDVEEFLCDRELNFETGITLPGIFSHQLTFDFLVKGHARDSLLQTLSTGNSQVSHHMALEAFAKWHDLEPSLRNQYTLVTIYDSSSDVFREDDVTRFREYSNVFAFPAEAESLAKTLTA